MRNIFRCGILLLALCLICGLVAGCSDKKDETVPATAATTTGGAGAQAGVQDRLSNPNVSEMEKEQIRKHMGGTGAAGAASSPAGSTTTAPGAGTAAPGGAGGQ